MARYIQCCAEANPGPREDVPAKPSNPIYLTERTSEDNRATNNAGRGANFSETCQSTQTIQESSIQEALRRSKQLAEQANQILERSSQSTDQSNSLITGLTELFGKLSQRYEQSNHLAKTATKSVEKVSDTLGNINRVLVRIQHAIVRVSL
ncbi:hypothetical protein B0J17DRAFT_56913 [Rhizoctonia solani]|nr:hypothetical protein B0J17DRAFT_56913 [Rhizoctonia solani]